MEDDEQIKEPVVKYSVLIPKSQHRVLKSAAVDNEISMQKLVREAIDLVLDRLVRKPDPLSVDNHYAGVNAKHSAGLAVRQDRSQNEPAHTIPASVLDRVTQLLGIIGEQPLMDALAGLHRVASDAMKRSIEIAREAAEHAEGELSPGERALIARAEREVDEILRRHGGTGGAGHKGHGKRSA